MSQVHVFLDAATLNITTLSILTPSKMALIIKGFITIHGNQHNDTQHQHQSVIMTSVTFFGRLNAIMMNVVMVSVVAPLFSSYTLQVPKNGNPSFNIIRINFKIEFKKIIIIFHVHCQHLLRINTRVVFFFLSVTPNQSSSLMEHNGKLTSLLKLGLNI